MNSAIIAYARNSTLQINEAYGRINISAALRRVYVSGVADTVFLNGQKITTYVNDLEGCFVNECLES